MPTFSFGEFMREGGWGMWPVLLLGLVALASATRYALRPERLCLRFIADPVADLAGRDRSRVDHGRRGGLSLLEDPVPRPRWPDGAPSGRAASRSTRPAVLGGIF